MELPRMQIIVRWAANSAWLAPGRSITQITDWYCAILNMWSVSDSWMGGRLPTCAKYRLIHIDTDDCLSP